MDLIDDERVAGKDVAVLEPPPRDTGRDDDDIPTWCLGSRLALSVDHTDPEVRGAEEFLRDGADRGCLSRAGAGDNAEATTRARQLAHARSEVLLEIRLDVESDREL